MGEGWSSAPIGHFPKRHQPGGYLDVTATSDPLSALGRLRAALSVPARRQPPFFLGLQDLKKPSNPSTEPLAAGGRYRKSAKRPLSARSRRGGGVGFGLLGAFFDMSPLGGTPLHQGAATFKRLNEKQLGFAGALFLIHYENQSRGVAGTQGLCCSP